MATKRHLRPASELLSPAVSATVAGLAHLRDSDAAVVRLAELYAQAIDSGTEGDELEKLGPRLLAALDALNATPKARAARAGARAAAEGQQHGGQLAALRSARPG